ncbi:MAG: Gfo/Idh/MocA family oxidoreductase [Planctomycetia bacterium]|nr:Gfo/Idh/MocA family oxidoreductase [Planctomycetia bacterium]
MSERIKMGVIGAGGAGRGRMKGIAEGKDKGKIEIAAVAEPNPDNIAKLEEFAGEIAQNRKYTGADGFEQMLKDGDLDAVGIFSPHSLHSEHLLASLGAGLHVLIEKPFVTGIGNAIRACKLAQEKDLTLLICYQRHFEPRYWSAREIIQKGKFDLGEVTGFYVYVAQKWGDFGGWRLDPKYSRGQPDDSGSHYQDILMYMTGLLPKFAEGVINYTFHGEQKRVPINSFTDVTLENGAAGKMIIMGDYHGGFSDDVQIKMTGGTIYFTADGVLVSKEDGSEAFKGVLELPVGYPESPEDNFTGLLAGRYNENYVPGIFGTRVALLADAIIAADVPGKVVDCEGLVTAAGFTMGDLKRPTHGAPNMGGEE